MDYHTALVFEKKKVLKCTEMLRCAAYDPNHANQPFIRESLSISTFTAQTMTKVKKVVVHLPWHGFHLRPRLARGEADTCVSRTRRGFG